MSPSRQPIAITSVISSVVTPTVTLAPEIMESDDDLPTGAIIGIIVGGFALLLIVLIVMTLVCVVTKKYICSLDTHA